MSLHSRLFRGDPALEACLVRDSAHVLLGAQGDHVGKIQSALAVLDHARIGQVEWLAKKYGRSTATAVLAYKKKRRIINFSYQTQADDIVGKMTIAVLDKEMAAFENRSLRLTDYCGDPVGQSGAVKAALVGSGDAGASPTDSAPSFSARLRIIWQPTAAAIREAQHRHLVMIPKANDILRPLGMEIVSPVPIPDTTVPNNDIVDPRFGADILRVRQDAEKQRASLADALRVIPCPFQRTDPRTFGLTDGGKGASIPELGAFQDFILINVRETRPDQLTLLHEMIHAATGLINKDHDSDPASVFSNSPNRSVLRAPHAEALSKAFFAGPR
jgi:peptidoglycan hydrolase-like protein with peptidoglycan-binding domain